MDITLKVNPEQLSIIIKALTLLEEDQFATTTTTEAEIQGTRDLITFLE